MFKKIEKYLIDNWEKIDIKEKKPACLTFSIKEHRLGGHICVCNRGIPIVWVKFNSSIYGHRIEKEYQNLTYIYQKINGAIKRDIPKPIALEKVDGKLLLIESVIRGQTMSEGVRPIMFLWKDSYIRKFSLIVKWLLEFQAQTKHKEVIVTKSLIRKYFLKPFMELGGALACSRKEAVFFKNYQKEINNIAGLQIPLVCSHGDFYARNIIFNGKKRLGVIDWMDLDKMSDPFLDIFTLLSTFRLPGVNNKKNIIDSLKFSFIEKNWFASILKQVIKEYLSLLNLECDLIKIFYPKFLINRILREKRCGDLISKQYWREHLNLYIENEEKFW